MAKASAVDPRVERTRKRVIEAALRLIHKGGPGAVTYSSLADTSGVGRATIYRHWPTLDELWPDLIHEARSNTRVEATGDLRSDLISAMNLLANNVSSQDGRSSFIAMLERAQWDPEIRRLADLAEDHSPVAQVLASAIVEGRLDPSRDPKTDASLLVGPLIHRTLVSGRDVTDDFIEHVTDSYITSLRNDL